MPNASGGSVFGVGFLADDIGGSWRRVRICIVMLTNE